MRASFLSSLCLCVMLGALGGGAEHARAQSGTGLLPPASIPNTSSPRTAPRSAYAAPSPVPRPVIDHQAVAEAVQEAAALPEVSTTEARPVDPDPTSLSIGSTRFIPPNPVPRSRLLLATPTDREELPDGSEDRIVTDQQRDERTVDAVSDPLCHQALRAAGGVFETRGRVEGEGPCGIDDAVALQSIGGITLQPAALIACPTATVFTAFVRETIAPRAERIMGADPTTLYIAASYVCRGRNNVDGARISEHGFGRAVDLRAVDLSDGQTWSVQPYPVGSEEPDARFQAALREEACGPFNTVLGPGSDGHHGDHLHFDNAPRSSTYCR